MARRRKRVTHKRAEELLQRVSQDEAYAIGQLGPIPGAKGFKEQRTFRNRLAELGYTTEEADELWRYLEG